MPGRLVLQNGAEFPGLVPRGQAAAVGETVFTTGMTGYVESLTDPSYSGQFITFTYPLIGNYGVTSEATWESERIQAAGLVASELTAEWSSAHGERSVLDWLIAEGVPLITGVDTRELTKTLRTHGTMAGVITTEETADTSLPETHLVSQVSCVKPELLNYGGGKRIVAVDCGVKRNSLRKLSERSEVLRVPHDFDFATEECAGIFLSNGPGDPVDCTITVEHLKRAMERDVPIFGICLGSQLLALAAGAGTYKLPYGHRGHNQPVIEAGTDRAFITSQNHGYAVDAASLPAEWEVWFTNVNDGSIEGIRHKTKPWRAVQFHPEAAPGPTDTAWLFEEFFKTL